MKSISEVCIVQSSRGNPPVAISPSECSVSRRLHGPGRRGAGRKFASEEGNPREGGSSLRRSEQAGWIEREKIPLTLTLPALAESLRKCTLNAGKLSTARQLVPFHSRRRKPSPPPFHSVSSPTDQRLRHVSSDQFPPTSFASAPRVS